MSGSSMVRLIHKYFRNAEVHISGKIQVSHVTILQLGLRCFLFQIPWLARRSGPACSYSQRTSSAAQVCTLEDTHRPHRHRDKGDFYLT